MNSEELFNKAKKLHINGKIKDAQVIYLQLLKTNSKIAIYYFYLELLMCN